PRTRRNRIHLAARPTRLLYLVAPDVRGTGPRASPDVVRGSVGRVGVVDERAARGRPPERVHEAQEGLADGRRAVGEGPRGRVPAGRGRAAGVAEQRVGHAAGRVVRVVDEVRAVRGDGRAPVPVHVVAQHEGRRLADGGVREAVHGPRGIGPYVVVERD